MKKLTVGILAHVDAGKTTLSEAVLYTCGSIRRLGRVDKKDAFLDTYGQERERGITIFSKQAVFSYEDLQITLMDTPGHVDFSAEMERTLQILDYAVLIISGSDGIQGHTYTLWKLLERYQIPVFIFVNKMDQPGTDKEALFGQLCSQLSEGCVDFTRQAEPGFMEEIAVCGEELLEEFLDSGRISKENIRNKIRERKIFPCFFGSALKLTGVREFLDGFREYTEEPDYPEVFGARVFKITRDGQGNRLTHMKVTGGCIRAKEMLSGRKQKEDGDGSKTWEEKIHQIRVYSGERYEVRDIARAGCICAVTGLSYTWSGEGLGAEEKVLHPVLCPVLGYQIRLPEGCDEAVMLPKLRQLEEEEPQLRIVWDERNKEIKAQIMGQVQTEVLKVLIEERFGVSVEFGEGSIVYKETIAGPVEGVGHFEPLRHYAEVHLLLEPGEAGSGILTGTDCGQDMLDKNWQRLILTHLEEREHVGVLTGAPITDMKITLVAGKAHQKHTEGGDFRQATYRAVRQGLMQAENILLEPWYLFRLEVPGNMVGRAMADLEKRQAEFDLETQGEEMAVLTGTAPVAKLQDYSKEVTAYTKGLGRLSCMLKGYFPCHNTQQVMERIGYEPLRDLENPASSVFCAHGAGFVVEWNQVSAYMHLERTFVPHKEKASETEAEERAVLRPKGVKEETGEKPWMGTEEIDDILHRTSHANQKGNQRPGREGWKRTRGMGKPAPADPKSRVYKPQPKKEQYLLVDGYNIIFAWQELKELAQVNLDGARGRLLDILCNYQAVKKCSLIAVFDAYRLAGHPTENLEYHNIHVVYTREAETADRYIERFAHENGSKYDVTVATSDGLEQIIIRGEGCRLLSANDLKEEVEQVNRHIREEFLDTLPEGKNYLFDGIDLPAFPEKIDDVNQP